MGKEVMAWQKNRSIRMLYFVNISCTKQESCLFTEKLVVMFEHQSTINENMPVRFLLYLAQYYND